MSERAIPELTLEWLPGRYAVCRLEPGAPGPAPQWLARALHTSGNEPRLLSITRTEREVAVVIEESQLPAEMGECASPRSRSDPAVQRGFVPLRIVGTLDFSLVGILARLTGALAAANVSVFVLSTYDTDIFLVHEADKQHAITALSDVARFK